MDLFGGSARDDDSRARRVPVSSVVIRRLWAQRRTDPTIGACCAHIVSRVMGGGFSFASLSGREPSREFTRHVETHVVPFAKTALDALLVQGYVVFDVRRRIRRAPFPVPFVCSERAYDAQVVLEDDETRVEIATDETHRRKRHVFVQDAPTMEGEPTSRLALVSRCVSYLEEIEKHDVRAFAVRACPPVLTRSQTDTAFDSRDVLGAADAVPGLRAQDEHDNMGIRNKINIAQFKQQQDLIRTLNDRRIDSSAGFWNQHVDPTNDTYLSETVRAHSEGYVPRFIPLPNDASVASFELPNERRDLVSLQRHVKKQICTGMGVPEALIDGTSGGGRQGEHAMRLLNEFSEVTLAPLRDAMRRLLLRVYALCFDEEESRDVECTFPVKQDSSRIIDYYERGFVTFAAVVRTLSQSENLAMTDFCRTRGEEGRGGERDEGEAALEPPRSGGGGGGRRVEGGGRSGDEIPRFEETKTKTTTTKKRRRDEEEPDSDDDDGADDGDGDEKRRKKKRNVDESTSASSDDGDSGGDDSSSSDEENDDDSKGRSRRRRHRRRRLSREKKGDPSNR